MLGQSSDSFFCQLRLVEMNHWRVWKLPESLSCFVQLRLHSENKDTHLVFPSPHFSLFFVGEMKNCVRLKMEPFFKSSCCLLTHSIIDHVRWMFSTLITVVNDVFVIELTVYLRDVTTSDEVLLVLNLYGWFSCRCCLEHFHIRKKKKLLFILDSLCLSVLSNLHFNVV